MSSIERCPICHDADPLCLLVMCEERAKVPKSVHDTRGGPRLDDPRIEPLQKRLHATRGHDWEPACGACFDEAFRYIQTSDVLALTEGKS